MTGNIKIDVSKDFEVSAEQVFDAWLDQENIGKWLFATDTGVMKQVEIDARVGGAFFIEELRGDDLAPHYGTYLEIDRPRKLVFEFSTSKEETPSLVTIEITKTQGGCHLKLTHEMEAKWTDYKDMAINGWTMVLQGLGKMLRGKE